MSDEDFAKLKIGDRVRAFDVFTPKGGEWATIHEIIPKGLRLKFDSRHGMIHSTYDALSIIESRTEESELATLRAQAVRDQAEIADLKKALEADGPRAKLHFHSGIVSLVCEAFKCKPDEVRFMLKDQQVEIGRLRAAREISRLRRSPPPPAPSDGAGGSEDAPPSEHAPRMWLVRECDQKEAHGSTGGLGSENGLVRDNYIHVVRKLSPITEEQLEIYGSTFADGYATANNGERGPFLLLHARSAGIAAVLRELGLRVEGKE